MSSSTEKSVFKKEGSVRKTNDIQICRVTEASEACCSSYRKGVLSDSSGI